MHDHAHPHGPTHRHDPEPGVQPTGGIAVLDIGDDVGALVVTLDRGRLGSELHVRPAGRPDAPTVHTGVRSRPLGGRNVVVAVFPHLHKGIYDVLGADGAPRTTVTVSGGRVAEATLI